jgi:multiple sugar transport system ATP-binding protein
MKDGLVQQFGTPSQIYDQPANTFVATFMGSPSMNLVPATALLNGGELSLLIEGTDVRVRLPVRSDSQVTPGQPVLFGLRPEWFLRSDTLPASHFGLRAAVDVLEPTGPDLYAALRVGPHEVMARLPADAPIGTGTEVDFGVDLTKALIFDRASGARVH